MNINKLWLELARKEQNFGKIFFIFSFAKNTNKITHMKFSVFYRLCSITFLFLCWACKKSNETTPNAMIVIPDSNFERALIEQKIDSDSTVNGQLKLEDALKITSLTISNEKNNKIKDLTGIEAFKNLKYLDCTFNLLTSLDVTKNTSLISLSCGINKLTTLDVSRNTALTFLDCTSTNIISLDVSKNAALTELRCVGNSLTTLDVSKNLTLTSLSCSYNNLILLDISKNVALTKLYCHFNKLMSLDISRNTALTDLYCFSNSLSNLDVSKNIALRSLDCSLNPTLKTICVKDVATATANKSWQKDLTATYAICQ